MGFPKNDLTAFGKYIFVGRLYLCYKNLGDTLSQEIMIAISSNFIFRDNLTKPGLDLDVYHPADGAAMLGYNYHVI